MAKVNFKRIENSDNIDTIDINDGNFIVTGDGKSYIDYGTNRIPTSGTPDTEMSDTSRNTVENKVIKDYVDMISSSHKPFLLWENPNRNAPFSVQSITLSTDDYDYLEIYYWDWSNNNEGLKDLQCQRIPKGYNTTLMTMLISGNAYAGVRRIQYRSDTEYLVGTCYGFIESGTIITPDTRNFWCVPVMIMGYKY